MQSEQRKELIMLLYKVITKTSKMIESDLDTLSDKVNSTDFELALSELSELVAKLIKNE